MNNRILLIIGIVLIVLGVFKPNISNWIPNTNNITVSDKNYITEAPTDQALLEKALEIKKVFDSSTADNKSNDCLRLSSLYADLAILIELDNEDMVIKDTASIREANSLCGKMLKLDIKNKYLGLSGKLEELVITAIGSDEVQLNKDLRQKAAEAFRALSWACYKGAK